MKINAILMVVLFLTSAVASTAQRYGSITYTYNNAGYGNYDDYRDYRYNGDYNRMSRADRRCLADLYEKLERRERRAWRDGYLSDYDVRRIRSVERDIERIYDKYRRFDRRNRYNNDRGRRNSRNRSVCR